QLAHMGLYRVKKQLQGMGIGSTLWSEVAKYIGLERNIAIHTTFKKINMYTEKNDFKFVNPRLLIHFEGKVKNDKLIKEVENVRIVVANEENIESVIRYDEEVTKINRGKYLRLQMKEKDALTLVAIDIRNSAVIGHGCFRTRFGGEGIRVGPVY